MERSLARAFARNARAVGVAVSGGPDSLQLMDSVAAAAGNARVVVLHVDHGVRAEAGADARFVAAAARRLGLPCRVVQLDGAGLRNGAGQPTEGRLRGARYRAFAELAAAERLDVVCLAHHRDDRVESILLAALRGAGLRGLAGMPRRRALHPGGPLLLRPFFDLDRAALRAALTARGRAWRDDASNADIRYRRNQVRHQFLPRLRDALGPDVDRRILRLGRLARVLWRRGPPATDLLHARLEAAAGRPLRKSLSLLLQAAHAADRTSLVTVAPGTRLRVGGGRLERVATADVRALPSTVRFHVHADQAGRVYRRLAGVDGGTRRAWLERRGRLVVDADRIEGQLVVRHRQPGDRFQPLGRSRPCRLKAMWLARRIPAADRDRLLVLCDAAGIVAVEGFPPAARAALTPATRRVLRVRFQPPDAAHSRSRP